MYKNLKVLGVAFICVLLGVNCMVYAQEGGLLEKLDIEASGNFDFYSQYIWRGFSLDTDPVIQSGFNLSAYGFTFSFWSSWDIDNNDNLNSDEIDYTIDYTKEFNNFSLSLGHTYYDFPGTNGYSREFYIGVGLLDFPLNPAFTYYHDYGDEDNGGGDGDYLVLEVSKSFDISSEPEIVFEIGAHVGYNHELFINGEGGDYLFTAGFSIPLTEKLTFLPTLGYSIPFGDVEDIDDGNQKERFYGGFSMNYSF
jgi:hypothetical protein